MPQVCYSELEYCEAANAIEGIDARNYEADMQREVEKFQKGAVTKAQQLTFESRMRHEFMEQ